MMYRSPIVQQVHPCRRSTSKFSTTASGVIRSLATFCQHSSLRISAILSWLLKTEMSVIDKYTSVSRRLNQLSISQGCPWPCTSSWSENCYVTKRRAMTPDVLHLNLAAYVDVQPYCDAHAARKLQRQIDSLDHLAIQN